MRRVLVWPALIASIFPAHGPPMISREVRTILWHLVLHCSTLWAFTQVAAFGQTAHHSGIHLPADSASEDSNEPLFSYRRTEEPNAVPASDAFAEATNTRPPEVTGPSELRLGEDTTPLPPVPRHDPNILRTKHDESADVRNESSPEVTSGHSERDIRRLSPAEGSDANQLNRSPLNSRADRLPFNVPGLESLTTAGAGLALVLGLFLLCVCLLRRKGLQPSSPLPREAFAVLGRIPLAPRQFAHLLQVGNKLVLVAITAERVDTLTEVTDPAEVERLLGLCMKNSPHGTTAEFQRILQQLSHEPAHGFLGSEATAPPYSQRRGDRH